MRNEDSKRLKRGLELVHPANHVFYRRIVAELQRALQSNNSRRMSSLNAVMLTLERYPMPIRSVQDAVMLAGVGDLTVMAFEAAIKRHGTPEYSREICAGHAEKVFARLRTFLTNTDFNKEPASTPGDWKPLRYSNAWTFIMVLGLFSDSETNGKLAVDDILQKAEELRRNIPKCKLKDLSCLRPLIERGLVEFSPLPNPSKVAKTANKEAGEVFSTKRKKRFIYGLTGKGRRMAEDLISACEVPISLKPRVDALLTQVSISQQTSVDDFEASGGSAQEPEGTNTSDNIYVDYYTQDTASSMRDNERNTASIGDWDHMHRKEQTQICTPNSDKTSQTYIREDIDSLISFRCSDPSQYVRPLNLNSATGHPEAVPEVISIGDSESSGGASGLLQLSQLQEAGSIHTNAEVADKSQQYNSEEETVNACGQNTIEPKEQSAESTDTNMKGDPTSMGNIARDEVNTPVSNDGPMHISSPAMISQEKQDSEGFRTPSTPISSIEVIDGVAENRSEIGNDGWYHQEHEPTVNKKQRDVYSTSPIYTQADIDVYDVTSDRYRRLMEGYDEAPQCYSQYGHDSDALGLGQSSPLVTIYDSDYDSTGLKHQGHCGNSIFHDGSIRGDNSHDSHVENAHTRDIDIPSDKPFKDEMQECIEINSSSQKSDSPVTTSQDALSQLSATYRNTSLHRATISPCDRFMPLKQRLHQKYGIDLGDNLGLYEIITVVDNREMQDADGRYQRRVTEIFADAEKTVVFRQLPLGDVIWLLKYIPENGGHEKMSMSPGCDREDGQCSAGVVGATEQEDDIRATQTENSVRMNKDEKARNTMKDDLADCFVLDWVVERKTTADLIASVTDGRYDDQKLRMLRLVGFKHVCYLFEDIEAGSAVGRVNAIKSVNAAAIASARIHTQLVTGFNVVRTTGMSHTASNILTMHKHIERCIRERMRDVTTISAELMRQWLERNYMKFHEWDVSNRKQNQMTFLELFGKQLRSIPGCGTDTTRAILSAWPTPFMLSQELRTSNMAYINETLAAHRTKGKRAPVSNNLYATLKALYVKRERGKADVQHK